MAHQPVFDLGTVAAIPARSDWNLTIKLYSPTATSTGAAHVALLTAGDVVRFRLFDGDDTDSLILATDAAPSAGGTTVTIDTLGEIAAVPAQVTIKLAAADTDINNGSYAFLLDIEDASDDRWQPACRGVIVIDSGPSAVTV